MTLEELFFADHYRVFCSWVARRSRCDSLCDFGYRSRRFVQEGRIFVELLPYFGREVFQNRVDIRPEAPFVKHKHPGEEIIYVLEGSLEYQVEGKPLTTVSASDVLLVPAETIHAVRNAGSGNAAELTTYVVEREKPLVVLVE